MCACMPCKSGIAESPIGWEAFLLLLESQPGSWSPFLPLAVFSPHNFANHSESPLEVRHTGSCSCSQFGRFAHRCNFQRRVAEHSLLHGGPAGERTPNPRPPPKLAAQTCRASCRVALPPSPRRVPGAAGAAVAAGAPPVLRVQRVRLPRHAAHRQLRGRRPPAVLHAAAPPQQRHAVPPLSPAVPWQHRGQRPGRLLWFFL